MTCSGAAVEGSNAPVRLALLYLSSVMIELNEVKFYVTVFGNLK